MRGAIITRIRTLVLMLAIIAGGGGAAVATQVHEASAAGPCGVGAVHARSTSGGYLIVQGTGAFSCTKAGGTSTLYVQLFVNGVRVGSAMLGSYNASGVISTNWAYCPRGSYYQTQATHSYNGSPITSHWSPAVWC